MDPQQNILPPQAAHVVDAGAAVTLVATWAGVVPIIGGILAACWYAFQIYVLYRREFFNKRGARRRKGDV